MPAKAKTQNWAALTIVALLLLAPLVITGCDEYTTEPDQVTPDRVVMTGTLFASAPEGSLDFVPVAVNAPPLATLDTSLYFVKGKDRRLKIRFESSGLWGKTFLKLEIEEETLWRLPDGTFIAQGDSVLIRVTVDPDLYVATFEPAGLQFDPDEPAELTINYEYADIDALAQEGQFELWRQEQPGDPWYVMGAARFEHRDRMVALLNGFTRYGLAIGN